MGYQFIHLDAYGRDGAKQRKKDPKTGRVTETRKWSARDIAAEAEREPDACSHVADPQLPRLLHGVMPSVAVAHAEDWASTARDAQGRALRRDGLCLAAGVISLPNEMSDQWPAFRAASVEWLRRQYGPRLRSVVEHTDEAHPHLHFYAVPLEGERFEVLHPGRLAAAAKALAGAKKGAQNAAYKSAMVNWQDSFASVVAADYGLARIGPGRRRLTRVAWQAEQAQARALAADRLDLFRPSEIAQAKERKLRTDQEQARKDQIAVETARRIKGLPGLLKRAGAALTLGEKAAEAIQKCGGDASKVKWIEVDALTINESMMENGQSAEDVIDAINRYSPGRADPASHQKVRDTVMRLAPDYERAYEQRRAERDQDQGLGW
jgi:hypothetical protein